MFAQCGTRQARIVGVGGEQENAVEIEREWGRGEPRRGGKVLENSKKKTEASLEHG